MILNFLDVPVNKHYFHQNKADWTGQRSNDAAHDRFID